MKASRQQEIDKHNYEYWLKTKTSGQRELKRVTISAGLSSKAQVMLALTAALGVTPK